MPPFISVDVRGKRSRSLKEHFPLPPPCGRLPQGRGVAPSPLGETGADRRSVGEGGAPCCNSRLALDLGHEIGKGHRIRQRFVAVWIGERMNVPAAGVVSAKDPLALPEQSGRCARLLVVEGVYESTVGNVMRIEIDVGVRRRTAGMSQIGEDRAIAKTSCSNSCRSWQALEHLLQPFSSLIAASHSQ